MSNNGWIEWKGGEMPVERGTLVDVKYRDGMETVGVSAGVSNLDEGFVRKSGNRVACCWGQDSSPGNIVAYRLHQEEKPELEQAAPTLDDLMHAWQKAKDNADTSRNNLKLAEQDEADARKALEAALRDTGFGDYKQDDYLDITDWRDLQPGDIVWWCGGRHYSSGEHVVKAVMPKEYLGQCPFRVQVIGESRWVDTRYEKWCFIRRPA